MPLDTMEKLMSEYGRVWDVAETEIKRSGDVSPMTDQRLLAIELKIEIMQVGV